MDYKDAISTWVRRSVALQVMIGHHTSIAASDAYDRVTNWVNNCIECIVGQLSAQLSLSGRTFLTPIDVLGAFEVRFRITAREVGARLVFNRREDIFFSLNAAHPPGVAFPAQPPVSEYALAEVDSRVLKSFPKGFYPSVHMSQDSLTAPVVGIPPEVLLHSSPPPPDLPSDRKKAANSVRDTLVKLFRGDARAERAIERAAELKRPIPGGSYEQQEPVLPSCRERLPPPDRVPGAMLRSMLGLGLEPQKSLMKYSITHNFCAQVQLYSKKLHSDVESKDEVITAEKALNEVRHIMQITGIE